MTRNTTSKGTFEYLCRRFIQSAISIESLPPEIQTAILSPSWMRSYSFMPFKNPDHISRRNFFTTESSISLGITILSLIILLLAKLTFCFFKVNGDGYSRMLTADGTVFYSLGELYLSPFIFKSVKGKHKAG